LLAEKLEVKEAVNRSLLTMTGLEIQAEAQVTLQVEHLAEAIQQLQQGIAYIELHTTPSTPQDVRDQREATTRSAVDRIKALSIECKKLNDCSA
jgi:hypothetical protein